jgi:hypothetical protein
LLFHKGTGWDLLRKGINGQTLRLNNGWPVWGEPGYALPIVATLPVTDVMQTAATCGGNIVNTGFSDVIARGVCWSVNQNPTTSDSKTNEGSGTGGSFSSSITGLTANTTYFVRAYATNGAGTAYSNQLTFKTYQNVVFPTISTIAATNVLSSTATSGGNVTETGGAPVTARGVCWSTNQNPTIADQKTTDGSGTGSYSSPITGLDPGTIYFVRAYATNSAGTGYGTQISLTTQKTVPIVATKNVTDISAMGGVSGGTITATGGSAITDKGIVWGENPNPTLADNFISAGTGQAAYSLAIIKAIPGTTYYVRAFAKNELGTGYGDQKTFTASEAAYFQSFETGVTPSGWSAPWSVSNQNSWDGSYSFLSQLKKDSETTFKFNIVNNCKIVFYWSFINASGGTYLEFYVDDIKMNSFIYSDTIWRQAQFDISPGNHIFKWRIYGNLSGGAYIDYIVITK